MTYRTIHPQFKATFSHFSEVPDAIQTALWNYLAYGLEPGSFVLSVLHNNFVGAMCKADSSWTNQGLKDLAKWLYHHAPRESFGDSDKINAWLALSYEERRDIMIDVGLRPSEFDILRGGSIV